MFICEIYGRITLEIDTYFIEETIFKMVKSRYTYLDKTVEGRGLLLSMLVNQLLAKVNEKSYSYIESPDSLKC